MGRPDGTGKDTRKDAGTIPGNVLGMDRWVLGCCNLQVALLSCSGMLHQVISKIATTC